MTHNPQPLHIDREAAKQSEFGQILVNGTFTFALIFSTEPSNQSDEIVRQCLRSALIKRKPA